MNKDKEETYEEIANALVEHGFIIIEEALEKTLAQRLYLYAKEQTAFKQAGISNTASKQVNTNKRSDKTLWLEEDNSRQSEYLAFMSGLQRYLNRNLFMGLSYYESHFALYEKGDFYEKHKDVFKNSKSRMVTTVYYLNSIKEGGELIMYDEENRPIKEIKPEENKLVIFLSNNFPHEVVTVQNKRYSIAGWFRVD